MRVLRIVSDEGDACGFIEGVTVRVVRSRADVAELCELGPERVQFVARGWGRDTGLVAHLFDALGAFEVDGARLELVP